MQSVFDLKNQSFAGRLSKTDFARRIRNLEISDNPTTVKKFALVLGGLHIQITICMLIANKVNG